MLDPVCQKICDVWEALRVVYSYSVSGEDIQQKLNALLTSIDRNAIAQMRQSDIKLFLNGMYNIFYLTLRIEKKRNVLSTRLNFVRPKIGIREKHLGKRQKYQKTLRKQYMKHEETYGEMRETFKEFATRGISTPLSHQFSNRFIHNQLHPRITSEYAYQAKQYIAESGFPQVLESPGLLESPRI